LTEEDKILLQYATEVGRLSKIVKARLDNRSRIVKKYHLGATLTIGGYVLPEIIGKYKRENENHEIILRVENTENIIKKLYAGDIDLGVIEGLFDRTRVRHLKLKDDELVLAVSADHPFARKKNVDIGEVLADRLILREKGSGTRMVFEDYLQRAGYRLEENSIYMEIGDITAIVSLVESNLGCTIISREVLKGLREFNFIFLADHDAHDDRFRQGFIAFCREQAPQPGNSNGAR
jgi:DNA-binding transcriptional LysR family regulator